MVTHMEYRDIPKAGICISRLSLGTVELGMEYGIGIPGLSRKPCKKDATTIISKAVENGINLFDTAPGYGESEAILGQILADMNCKTLLVATKVGPFENHTIAPEAIERSLESSLRTLRRERLDLVQIHNADAHHLHNSPLMEVLVRARNRGDIGGIGASVYGEEAALAALEHPDIATLQIGYNLLDQRMKTMVLPLAKANRVAILGRSVFLKGVLTERRHQLPEKLKNLKAAGQKVNAWAVAHAMELTESALRFSLTEPGICSVLIGISSEQEIEMALTAMAKGPLSPDQQRSASQLAVTDPSIVDPRVWEID